MNSIFERYGKLAISVITRAEVLTGFEGRDRQLARRLLDRFPLLIIDRPIADLAATLRRQSGPVGYLLAAIPASRFGKELYAEPSGFSPCEQLDSASSSDAFPVGVLCE